MSKTTKSASASASATASATAPAKVKAPKQQPVVEDPYAKYVVKISTVQAQNFKALITILKDNNISEANLRISEEGIEIIELDPTKTIVVQVKLKAENFNEYHCRQPVTVGIDTQKLANILKCIGAKDILTIFIEDSQKTGRDTGRDTGIDVKGLGLLIENSNKGQISNIYITQRDINEENSNISDLDFQCQIQLPSADLQSIIGNLKNIGGSKVRILFHKDSLKFSSVGDLGEMEIIRLKTNHEDSSIKIQKNDADDNNLSIVDQTVQLDRLLEFVKCSCLSSIVTIRLENDLPVFLEYDVGNLGVIKLLLSPCQSETADN